VKRSLGFALVALFGLAALAAGAWLGPKLGEDPGYVLIEVAGWRLQMSLLTLMIAVLGIWLATSLLLGLIRLPTRGVRSFRRMQRQKALERGLLALSEGDWESAERSLARSMRGGDDSPIGYLAAARAAQGQMSTERRDQYLAMADRRSGHRHFVTALVRSRLLAAEDRHDDAIPLLEELHLKKPRHHGVLKLLLQCYQDCERWHEVRLLVPAIRRAGIVPAERATELESLAAARELGVATDSGALLSVLGGLSKPLRQRAEVIQAFARRAVELDRPDLAEPELRRALNAKRAPELLALYADADESDRAGRIQQCEQWLRNGGDSPALRLALGRLYLGGRNDQQARAHLEAAVRGSPDSRAYAALGQVLDRAGELEAATQCYRNALRLEQGRAPEPLPSPDRSA
jgi:HemY protein